MGEDGHRQHRRHGTAVDWGSSASSVRPGDQGPKGPLRTAREACADDADGADATFSGLISLADAENTIDRWKPFSSLAVPGSSAATPVRRSPHLVGSQFAFYDLSRGHGDFTVDTALRLAKKKRKR
jgi:hypothetical protein